MEAFSKGSLPGEGCGPGLSFPQPEFLRTGFAARQEKQQVVDS
jgi:hypothetical protein